ncbi:MAG TPA: ABC transporter permease subunit [Candidatus Dormibacteraeota bacterium]|nr:ABC transporter permease subunit [Candidatus Dormibacteraeota bacterium]
MSLGVRDLTAILRLDLAETIRSRWALFCVALYTALGLIFVFVGMRESTLLGFTGMGRVLVGLSHAMLMVLPLLALTASSQVINRAREEGALEVLLSHPIRRGAYFLGITVSRYLVLTVPLLVLFAGLSALGATVLDGAVMWNILARSLLVSAALLAAFLGIGLAISTFVVNPARSATIALVVWILAVALLDFALIGVMLQWRLQPQGVFALALLNPVQAARMALLSAGDPELSTLGPIGFYLANRVGAAALLGFGVAWPLFAGFCAWLLAYVRFTRGDVA